jgi:hypothetical protein
MQQGVLLSLVNQSAPYNMLLQVVSKGPELDKEKVVRDKENIIRLEPIPSIPCPATVITHHESFIISPISTILPLTPLMSTSKSSSLFRDFLLPSASSHSKAQKCWSITVIYQ